MVCTDVYKFNRYLKGIWGGGAITIIFTGLNEVNNNLTRGFRNRMLSSFFSCLLHKNIKNFEITSACEICHG